MVILLQKQILTCKNSIYQNDTEKTWKTKKTKKIPKMNFNHAIDYANSYWKNPIQTLW